MASSIGTTRPLVDTFLTTQDAKSFLNGLPAGELAYVLYEELLGRCRDLVDAEGLQATIEEIEDGRLADRIAAMLDSTEFAEKFGTENAET